MTPKERAVVKAAMRYYQHCMATQTYLLRHKCGGTTTRLQLLAACKRLAKKARQPSTAGASK